MSDSVAVAGPLFMTDRGALRTIITILAGKASPFSF